MIANESNNVGMTSGACVALVVDNGESERTRGATTEGRLNEAERHLSALVEAARDFMGACDSYWFNSMVAHHDAGMRDTYNALACLIVSIGVTDAP